MKTRSAWEKEMTGNTFEKFHLPFIKQFVAVNAIENVLEIGESKIASLESLKENSCNIITIDLTSKLGVSWDKERVEKQLSLEINEKERITLDQPPHFDLIIINDLTIQTVEMHFLLEGLMNILEPEGAIFVCFRPKFPFFSEYSVEKFREFITNSEYFIKAEKLYWIDPVPYIKHNFGPYEVGEWIRKIPYIRNLFSSLCSYIIARQTYHIQTI